eukprot:234889_1
MGIIGMDFMDTIVNYFRYLYNILSIMQELQLLIICYKLLSWYSQPHGWLAYGTDITGEYKVGLSHICGHGPQCVEVNHYLYEYFHINAERFHDHVEIDKKIKLMCLMGQKLGFTQISLEPGDKKLCKHNPACIRTVGTSRNHNIQRK